MIIITMMMMMMIIIIIIIIIIKIPTSLPKEKAPLQPLRRRPPRQQSRNRSRQLLLQRPPPQRLQGPQIHFIVMSVQLNLKLVSFSQFIKTFPFLVEQFSPFCIFASFSHSIFSVSFMPLIYINRRFKFKQPVVLLLQLYILKISINWFNAHSYLSPKIRGWHSVAYLSEKENFLKVQISVDSIIFEQLSSHKKGA